MSARRVHLAARRIYDDSDGSPSCGAGRVLARSGGTPLLSEQADGVTCGRCLRNAASPKYMAQLAADEAQASEYRAEKRERLAQDAELRIEAERIKRNPVLQAFLRDTHEWDMIGLSLARQDPKRFGELLDIARKYAEAYVAAPPAPVEQSDAAELN